MPNITDETLLELSDDEIEEFLTSNPTTDAEIEEAYSKISFRVVYQTHNYLLPQIRDLIDNREIFNLRPEYQRRSRWDDKKKSLLIESLLLNIPVPPIFLYENELARYEVMDGQQRLNAIHSFLENDFALSGLEKLTFLHKRTYRRLPPRLKRALDRSSLSAVVLLHETQSDATDPYLVRRYVFERLNTGGQPLNRQEMRNSIYRGPFNDLIVELSRNADFCACFGIPLYTETDQSEYYENPDRQKNRLYSTMGDCQIVLRFFALDNDANIAGSMDSILNKTMTRRQKLSEGEIALSRKLFEKTISKARLIFGDDPFLLEGSHGKGPRVSVALYDAIMGALGRREASIEKLEPHAAAIRAALQDLKRDRRDLLTGQANTAAAIKERIAVVGAILDKFLR
ncbi:MULTISPECIES: DUF262 domain-containing protein [unclassified Mesorhizobium]|uniref:DUF262 domain-containing protein n=1 Tax=unclassified Mesorhizobium TaxID=325217 RepID=UPI00333CB1BB